MEMRMEKEVKGKKGIIEKELKYKGNKKEV